MRFHLFLFLTQLKLNFFPFLLIEKFQKYSDIIFVGNGSLLHKELILKKINNAKFCDNNIQNAYSCGLVGLKKYNLKELVTPDELLPNYLRKSRSRKAKK